MNPISIVVVFIVILAVLIYYLQSRESTQQIIPQEKPEPNIVKVKDYETQSETEHKEATAEKPVDEEKTIKTAEEKTDIDDIAELEGVGPKYQELLRSAGYTSIKLIAESNPEELYEKLMKANEEKNITKRPPTIQNIEDWVKAAGSRLN